MPDSSANGDFLIRQKAHSDRIARREPCCRVHFPAAHVPVTCPAFIPIP
jgi:hypothetical protein